jgi:serralysin
MKLLVTALRTKGHRGRQIRTAVALAAGGLALFAAPAMARLIYGTNGADTINGTTSADTIYAQKGGDTVHGRSGNDRIYGQTGRDTLYGDSGDDYIEGNDQGDSIFGGNGDDVIRTGGNQGDGFTDYANGNAGNDRIYGGPDDDVIYGGIGDDVISTRDGIYFNDEVGCGGGHDTVYVDKAPPDLAAEGYPGDAEAGGADNTDCEVVIPG